jgi:hypothetical protein
MAECAPLGGAFHKSAAAIEKHYGRQHSPHTPGTLYRVDRLDLPETATTTKPILSWSRTEAGARHFYDYFTNGVNRWGSSMYGWRIICAEGNTPLVSYEAMMAFLADTNDELYEWLAVEEMRKSEEVICVTPPVLNNVAVCQRLERIPLGPKERARLSENKMREIFGMKELPAEALGT